MKKIPVTLTFLIVAIALLVVNGRYNASADEWTSIDDTSRRQLASPASGCIKWGNTFDVPLQSKNVARPCSLPDGRAICCSAVNPSPSDYFSKPIGNNYNPAVSRRNKEDENNLGGKEDEICTIQKTYISSPQELRDLAMADKISTISDDHTDATRFKTLMEYVLHPETLKNSTKWLSRVSFHMGLDHVSEDLLTHDDYEYLSRFEVTRKCGAKTERWIEWIEPVTITARHPFAFGSCRPVRPLLSPETPRVGRSNVDYVLLQSGKALFDQSYNSATGRRWKYSNNGRRIRNQPVRHFMLDAGTSTFDSSLLWFTCGFAQRKVGFDRVYAWEMTLLEPRDYWRRVPMQWKHNWHFYNVPISANSSEADSPIRFVQAMAQPEDFVAFKLDIDSPDYEMPIALSLLSDESLASLVDEFFFELHFRCEVMTSCGWGKRVPKESHGLVLDRPQILRFFIDLRKKGIRAHIWP